MNTGLVLILAFILSFVLTPLFFGIGWRLKILDYPKADKVHAQPTPLTGGIAIFLAFFIVILFAVDGFDAVHKALFISGAIVFISGLVDDIKPITAVKRLIVQCLAAIILIYAGASFTFLPNNMWGTAGEMALTFFWLVGITNAFNYLDGLNGLASGVAIISALFFFIFASATSQVVLACMLIAFLGACAGFFPYNFFQGKIFLGNSGSGWIGFTLAGLAVMGDWALRSPVDLIMPILIFGVPIFDMVNTTTVRILDKKTKNMVELLTYRGKDHFHHRLTQTGLGEKGAVLFIYVICVMLGLNGLLLQLSHGIVNIVIILCVSTMFFFLISFLIKQPHTSK
ncbi:MAG: undecaprenyl/decaprenyl-phosphate alpha-N-acetylglucosaminyl 1-phosphate transferase [Candidatus Omnitrophica bacterium]|nr:undecaprenyl/decaprenyl-phosphate alpha-N-acetylglucosaminyl 1-phosphate transferase [Candidatus Omnitrophota bacterium]